MQRWIGFLVIGALLFEQTALGELAKLPALFAHYRFHDQKNPTLPFSDFLFIHYWGNDGDPSDDAAEQKMPFKHFPNLSNGSISVFIVSASSLEADKLIYTEPQALPSVFDQSRISKGFCAILTPPPKCFLGFMC